LIASDATRDSVFEKGDREIVPANGLYQTRAELVTAKGSRHSAKRACHQAANVGMVVIKVPTGSSFPDQDFRPVKP